MKTLSAADRFARDMLDLWERYGNLAGVWWSRHAALGGDETQARLQALVTFAREASPCYRRLYARVPRGNVTLRDLPAVDKERLMGHFDDWTTDRRVRRADVARFLRDRENIGKPFLGKYHVWKSSGTSGTPGIFLQDSRAMSVYEALVLAQLEDLAIDVHATTRHLAAAGRSALVAATGDHFASITCWNHLGQGGAGRSQRIFSVLEPTARLVDQLNEFQPSFLASYPSVLRLLAAEQDAGRLAIRPSLAWSGGEFLGDAARGAIEASFGCRVMNEYGASECLSIAFGCREGWLHVNSEWVILEGVEADGSPTPPGRLSHTTLLTNLANRVQPIIRYDLGDRIIASACACACGNPRPAIRVEGRRDATLLLRAGRGPAVHLAPLALSTVLEEAAGEHRFQIAQVASDRLLVRFDVEARSARARTGRLAKHALEAYLASQSLAGVGVELDRAAPRIDPRSGKLHAVTVEFSRGARIRKRAPSR